ncbi:MAG: type II secretion system minor pseudopilin GspJ [Marinicaulis sp.]|nr:type II secretion system minor pseudopilin GspJ [Marinicaulis sp.]
MMRWKEQRGVTMPEVLISLLILSLIASACVYALRLGVDSRDQLVKTTDELRDLQIARILIKEDLAQFVDRRVRDEFGNIAPQSFTGGDSLGRRRDVEEGELLFSFVRGGRLNPNAVEPRSALQYVEYVYLDNAVRRRARDYLDESASSEMTERILFDGLAEARAEFPVADAVGDIDWVREWPVAGRGDGAPPPAAALVLFRPEKDEERHLFWIGEF